MRTLFVLNMKNFIREDMQSDIKASLQLFIALAMMQWESARDVVTSDIPISRLNLACAIHTIVRTRMNLTVRIARRDSGTTEKVKESALLIFVMCITRTEPAENAQSLTVWFLEVHVKIKVFVWNLIRF